MPRSVSRRGHTPLEPGDRVRLVPNHSCVVSNLVDQAWVVDGDDGCSSRCRSPRVGRIT